ncbi:alkaline phosphatase family protein [Roseicella aquatilis]|uniref:Alkaline phosphatase family protein n=1 Tax=Roseicella aquatilis TaxID=2527868 RepID=A0A4R4D6V6_9PROT|nr:nucleotide pyrophosphatase/phosphodiesterase family protein [Roseicella aquatilis]TCZ54243.1 alkaline phosphatase family protein [Roseicella aquatilis]
MHSTLVVLVVGLTPRLVGEHTPNLASLAKSGGLRPLTTVLPAVTCTVQSTLLTGELPRDHGIVANGWYFRDLSEVMLWRQSNQLVAGEKVWETAKRRDPTFTCAQMFWWYNMYSTADISATPRPMYPADGRKIPDHYAEPPELHDELDRLLGPFPLFRFWGPATDITSTRWIARATAHVMHTRHPTLALCYLPHLDYGLQKWGPSPEDSRVQHDLAEVDAVCGELFEAARREGRRVVVVSEYGILPVREAVHINRALREAGLIRVRVELGREILDPGASRAFALADHQIAHVHVRDPRDMAMVRALLEKLDGVDEVLDTAGKRAAGIDHPRSGELVALAAPDRWFSYYWWLDDDRAPDFARTVDIHRKPGYDPMELFLDPAIRAPQLRIARRLLQRRLGFRALMDVTPIQGTHLVRGSHGRLTPDPLDGPLVISSEPGLLPAGGSVRATDFKALVLDHVFGREGADVSSTAAAATG